MAGISSKAAGGVENNSNKFQNQEFTTDFGVDIYEFKYRAHDPQIGRFWQVDPLANDYVYNSTYSFSENHVTVHIELEGLEKVPINSEKKIPNIVTTNVSESTSQGRAERNANINIGPRRTTKSEEKPVEGSGYMLTSKNAVGQNGTKTTHRDGQPINIDNVLDAFGAIANAGPLSFKPSTDGWSAAEIGAKGVEQIRDDLNKDKNALSTEKSSSNDNINYSKPGLYWDVRRTNSYSGVRKVEGAYTYMWGEDSMRTDVNIKSNNDKTSDTVRGTVYPKRRSSN